MVLRDNLVMAGLIHRDFEDDVAGAGDRVHTRLPAKLTAHTWTNQAGTGAEDTEDKRLDLPTAANVTVLLDQVAYTSMLIQDVPQTMAIKSIRDEFVVPLLDPLAQRVDDSIMTEFVSPASTDVNGVPVDVVADGTVGLGAALDQADIIEADLQLNIDQAPVRPRWLVLSAQHKADVLGLALFHQANTAGTDDALRQAIINNAFGFNTVMSQNVPAAVDTDGTPQSIAFHRNAAALVVRPLLLPPSGLGVQAAVQSMDNVSIRITQQYFSLKNGVAVIAEVLYGVQLLDARLAKIINP